MAFKTDSIKLKNYASDSARNTAFTSPYPTAAAGDIVVNAGALQVYSGSAWNSIDTSPSSSNTVRTAAWIASTTLPDGLELESLVYYNTMPPGAHQLKIPNVSSYGSNAKLEIINGANIQLQLARELVADQSFWWRASSSGAQVTTIEIGPGQRALLLKTAAAYWEVIVLTL